MADILARQRQIIGTAADWAAHDLPLGAGELALVRPGDGTVRAKVGDGTSKFSDSPWLQGSVAAFTYRGNRDPAGPAPVGAASGDAYSAQPGGVVDASWGPPAAGTTVDAGDLLVMDAAGQWNVIPIGGEMTGVVMRTDLLSPAGATMVGVSPSGTLADALGEALTPEMFGAVGDGVTNDQPAFDLLQATLTARGGGVINMRARAVYMVGKQTEGKNGYRYFGETVILAENMDRCIINGNGATMKMNPGLLFGGFDENDVPTTAIPNVNVAQQANQGYLVRATNCRIFACRDLYLDGNSAAGIVGGPWGDTGRQCAAYGLYVAECAVALCSNIIAYEFLLDCFAARYVGETITSEPHPYLFLNCVGRRAGRNVMSHVGGKDLTTINCVFREGGFAPNAFAGGPGYVLSAPGSCYDVEAEGTIITATRHFGSHFLGGLQSLTCFVADSGDSRAIYFNKCTFDGAFWTNKPQTVLENCVVNGKFTKVFGITSGANSPDDATKLIRCRGGDSLLFSAKVIDGLFIDFGGSGPGVQITDCYWYLAKTRLNWRGGQLRRTAVTFAFGTTSVPNKDYAALLDSPVTFMEDLTFIDATGSAAGDPYPAGEGVHLLCNSAKARNCMIVAGSNYTLKWNSWSPGGGGYPTALQPDGSFDIGLTYTFQEFRLQREANFGGGFNGWMHVSGRNAAPVVGTYNAGTLVFNSDPAIGEASAWALNAAKTQFLPTGIYGAVRAASVPLAAGATPTKAEFDALINAMKTANLMA